MILPELLKLELGQNQDITFWIIDFISKSKYSIKDFSLVYLRAII